MEVKDGKLVKYTDHLGAVRLCYAYDEGGRYYLECVEGGLVFSGVNKSDIKKADKRDIKQAQKYEEKQSKKWTYGDNLTELATKTLKEILPRAKYLTDEEREAETQARNELITKCCKVWTDSYLFIDDDMSNKEVIEQIKDYTLEDVGRELIKIYQQLGIMESKRDKFEKNNTSDKEQEDLNADEIIAKYLETVDYNKSITKKKLAQEIVNWAKNHGYREYSVKTIRPKLSSPNFQK